MFTGIVEEVGWVRHIERHDDRAELDIACSTVLADAAVGDSIAVEGCCLTVTELTTTDGDTTDGFTADLMAETLRATALGGLEEGSPVNLERPLRADGRFGGHLVQGHVDGVGEVSDVDDQPGTRFLTLRAPADVVRYLVEKGSVTVAGVSLTVVDVDVDGDRFRVGLIPHTCEVTTLGRLRPGDAVNLEVDILAKYVERLVDAG